MDAKLVKRNRDGFEIRYAKNTAMKWPGNKDALGRRGYWVGDKCTHCYIGMKVSEYFEEMFKHAHD